MKYLITFVILLSLVSFWACGDRTAEVVEMAPAAQIPVSTPEPAASDGSDEVFDGKRIELSVDEWRARLTGDQFDVLREEGTEPAFTGEYDKFYEDGDYYCAACHLKLFSSQHKFNSGTGWPSFFQPVNAKNVTEKTDRAFGVTRTEVECSRCGSHLGHVFEDGPRPTGLRYCINSVALKFEGR